MLALLMTLTIGTLLLSLVSLVALLSILRLQRAYAADRVLNRRSRPADFSRAISYLTPTMQPSVTIYRPPAANPNPGAPLLPPEEMPTQPEMPVITIQPDKARPDDHNVQPLLDYLKAALAERTG